MSTLLFGAKSQCLFHHQVFDPAQNSHRVKAVSTKNKAVLNRKEQHVANFTDHMLGSYSNGVAFGILAKSTALSVRCKAWNWVSWLLVLVAKDLLGHVPKSIPRYKEVAQLPETNAAKHKGSGCP